MKTNLLQLESTKTKLLGNPSLRGASLIRLLKQEVHPKSGLSSSGSPDKSAWKKETLFLPACLYSPGKVHLFCCCSILCLNENRLLEDSTRDRRPAALWNPAGTPASGWDWTTLGFLAFPFQHEIVIAGLPGRHPVTMLIKSPFNTTMHY